MSKLAHALGVALPAEHLVDDIHVTEQIGDDAVMGLALHVVEHYRAAAIHVLLQAGDLQVGVDGLVGLDQVALRLEPGERRAQVACVMSVSCLDVLFLDVFLHRALSSMRGANASAPAAIAKWLRRGHIRPESQLHRFLSISIKASTFNVNDQCSVSEVRNTP